MRRLLILLAFLPISACGPGVDQIGNAADAARSAAEHAADRRDAANAAKETKIFADARGIAQQAQPSQIEENGGRPRYEIRQDGMGDHYSIYDTENQTTVRIGSKPQAGMSHADAEEAFASLQQEQQRKALEVRQ